MTRRLLVLALLLPMLGCKANGNGLRDPVNPEPTPTPPPLPRTITVDYRVTGSIPNTHITYFSTIQGTTQVTTDLPWAISFQTTELHPFLYLAAQSPFENIVNGNIIVQIFVNGVLFREARGNGFEISVAASGEVS
jgi:hypothetical protein